MLSDVNERAERTVAAILKDFTGRRGLRQSWDLIDDDIQEEILAVWRKIAADEIELAYTLGVEDGADG